MSAEAFYLDDGARSFFAFFHPPATTTGGVATAVVLCPPFGWDDICSYRSRRRWAEELAAGNHPVLRLDLPGSGDSPEGPGDPRRQEAWTEALLASARWLRANTDTQRVALVGIGLTGIAAVQAALAGDEFDELVLWGVGARGRTVLRELRAFARLEVANEEASPNATAGANAGAATRALDADEELQQEEGLVVNGYRLSADTVAELERLDLTQASPARARPLARVLLLERDGLKIDERLRGALEAHGAALTVGNGTGYGEMTRAPQDARAPVEVFELTAAWLAEGEREHGDATGAPTTPAAAPERHDTLHLTQDGTPLAETPFHLDRGAEGSLFGVLCEPEGEPQPLCAVLLNAGPQRHTGPNRMWVETARRWAAMGVPALRIDLAGIGDSDGDSDALVRVAALYSHDFVTQTRGVLDALEARGLGSRFTLLGLCAGAYWSAHAALEDERVAGTIMLNPRALIWDEWRYTVLRTRDLRERLLRASTWRRVLRGEITLARHLETGRALAGRAAQQASARIRRTAAKNTTDSAVAGDTPVDELLDALRERDQPALLLLTGREPLREEFETSGLMERLERWPNIELSIRGTAADTHTLTPPWLQRQVNELADAAMRAELQRAREREQRRA
jgi:pimeloyl-ACP methyl ester carboxylesterase